MYYKCGSQQYGGHIACCVWRFLGISACSEMSETDGDMLRNGSEVDEKARSECEEGEGTVCEEMTETLVHKERDSDMLHVLTDISSKICFFGRHLTSWVMS